MGINNFLMVLLKTPIFWIILLILIAGLVFYFGKKKFRKKSFAYAR